MALRLIVVLGLIFSAAAAPAQTSRFQFDFSKILGTAAAQETKGSIHVQDGSRSTLSGNGRTSFAETSGRSGAIRPWDSNGALDAIVNSGSSTINTAGGGVVSSTWGRADTSATANGVGAAEISSKSGTLDAYGSGTASMSSGRGGGGGSRAIVETLSKTFQNIYGQAASGKATGETTGTGPSQVNIDGRSQAQHNGAGGVSSASAMPSAGGTATNGQKANVLTQHQAVSNAHMSMSSSKSIASLSG